MPNLTDAVSGFIEQVTEGQDKQGNYFQVTYFDDKTGLSVTGLWREKEKLDVSYYATATGVAEKTQVIKALERVE